MEPYSKENYDKTMDSFLVEFALILMIFVIVVLFSSVSYNIGQKSMREALVAKGLAEYRLKTNSDSTVEFVILSPEEIAKKIEAK